MARVALSQGVKLVAPLPLPRAEYEKDFVHPGDPKATENSLAEFDRLLQQAAHHFELPLAAGNTAESITSYGAERDRQYLQVGADIVRQSYILLALWDGDMPEPEPMGGTSLIVRMPWTAGPTSFLPRPTRWTPPMPGP